MGSLIRMSLAGSAAVITLGLVAGCDKTATAGAGGVPPTVVRGAPINKAVDPPATISPSGTAAPSTDAAPEMTKKPTATVDRAAAPEASAASAKPDRASLRPAVKKSKDDKTPVGAPDKDRPEYLRVDFDELASYDYDPYEAVPPDLGGGPAAAADEYVGPKPADIVKNSQIPPRILALDKKRVVVQGFMVPIEFKRDSVRSFLLVRNQMMCCFGAMIGMNEWVMVQMDGEKRTSFVQDVPMTVFGEIEVGEDIQNGMVMSLYRLKGFETQFKGGR